MFLRCNTCGGDWSTCPCGNGKSLTPAAAVRKRWIETIPEATRLGTCTVARKCTIFRIQGHQGPYVWLNWLEPVDAKSTPSDDGEVFAKVASGKVWLVRRFMPIVLSERQMERLGFSSSKSS